MTDSDSFFKVKVLISRDVDSILEQIIDYTLRDYLYNWASDFIPNDKLFKESLTIKIKNEIWLTLRKLLSRLQDIDTITFITETLPKILKRHFEKFNLSNSQSIDENQHLVRFMVANHLEDDRAELEFLRKICEYLLRILLPNNYAGCDEFVFLIREVLSNHVLFNLIDYICDPYFLNHRAIVYGAVVGPVTSTFDIQPFADHDSDVAQQQQQQQYQHQQDDFNSSIDTSCQYLQQNQQCLINVDSNAGFKPCFPHMEKHINKTKAKIDELRHKLSQKVLELNTMDEVDLLTANISITNDIEQLRSDIHELECHLTRAELWLFNIGSWLVDVHCVERMTETEEMLVLFLVYTDRAKAATASTSTSSSSLTAPSINQRCSSTGWVTIRSLVEVCDQKRRFSKKIPALRKLEHPIFRRHDKGHSTTPQSVWKKELQQFFDLITKSEQLIDSEEAFLFLSPTPRHIVSKVSSIPTSVTSKLSKLPFLPYFGVSPILLGSKSNNHGKQKGATFGGYNTPFSNMSINSQQSGQSKSSSYASSPLSSSTGTFFESENSSNTGDKSLPASGIFGNDFNEETKEDISEAIHELFREIFELKAQMWLRRTIILFFQIAFGKTINKQIKDTVSQLTDETFIAQQLINFRDTFWPNGQLADEAPKVSEDDMKLTYLLAKQYLMNSIPDVFNNLIGQQNARKGFLKVFEALQNKKANKQLFYDVLESFLIELSPELKQK